MARFTVYPANDEWCVAYEALVLVSFGSREMAEQAAINLAQAAVKKGDLVSIVTQPEVSASQTLTGPQRETILPGRATS